MGKAKNSILGDNALTGFDSIFRSTTKGDIVDSASAIDTTNAVKAINEDDDNDTTGDTFNETANAIGVATASGINAETINGTASGINNEAANGVINETNAASGEVIVRIPLDQLHPPDFHPFQVNDDKAMERLARNIKKNGVREPGIVRLRQDEDGNHIGGYELLCGNRRKRACEIAGEPTLPVIIRDLDDNEAAIIMVDSNLEQRVKILLSEKAWAYQVKLEALNHQGVKSANPGELSVTILSEQTGESKNQIFRLVRLTKLIIALLDKADAKQLAFNPAVELSYLTVSEQAAVASAMESYDVKPSLSQAKRLKELSKAGELTVEKIDIMLSEVKKQPRPPKGESVGGELAVGEVIDVVTVIDEPVNGELAMDESIDGESTIGEAVYGELTIHAQDNDKSASSEPVIGESVKGEFASSARIRKYFPADYSSKQVEDVIISLLKEWQHKQRKMESLLNNQGQSDGCMMLA